MWQSSEKGTGFLDRLRGGGPIRKRSAYGSEICERNDTVSGTRSTPAKDPKSTGGVKDEGKERRGVEASRDWVSKECSFYQIRHALQDAQDFRIAQLIVGKVKDAEFQALL